jgi:predicted phosphodiesterase
MGNMIQWNEERQDLLRVYLEQGLTDSEISKKMNLTYDQVAHAIRRYNLRDGLEDEGLVFSKDKTKLKDSEINTIGKLIGEKLYENYKVIRLNEPKAKENIGKREETSILDISDVHVGMINEVFDSDVGKKVTTYNMDVFRKELFTLEKSVKEIHSILSNSYSLKELNIFMLGDLITNDRIFPEQSFEIEKVVGLQIWDAINYFTKFFNNLLSIYEKINIICVVGNHGRSNPIHYEEPVQNNFEYFIYKTWEKQFEGSKRINIVVPDTQRYVYKILNWKHLIEHGHSMKGGSDTNLEKQIKELSLNMGGFDVFHYGHFHKLKEREISDKVIVKQNGCWIPKDNYGYKKFKTYSVPKQHFFGCNLKRPETWAYKIDLRG